MSTNMKIKQHPQNLKELSSKIDRIMLQLNQLKCEMKKIILIPVLSSLSTNMKIKPHLKNLKELS